MAENTNDRSKDHENSSGGDTPKKPSHLAYQVSDGQDGKSYFNRIGAAFEHRDHQGYNIALDAVPVDGKITLRTLKDRVEQARDGKSADRSQEHEECER